MAKQNFTTQQLTQSLTDACRWLTDVAQIKHAALFDEPVSVSSRFDYDDFRGAIKGEYFASTEQWSDFCPIWHTGQAVAALARASQTLGEPAFLDAARFSAEFILRYWIDDPDDEDYGLILAYEGEPDWLNTSAIMECLAGLIELHRITTEQRYLAAARTALQWIARKMVLPGEGLIRDLYRFSRREVDADAPGAADRPLADDAVFLVVGRLAGDEGLKKIHFEVLERLLRDEDPPGNWICYGPCDAKAGSIHPRHAYWWGMPFLDGYQEIGDQRYLDAAVRSGQWYIRAQRADGGLFRGTYRDFNTDSFGHATSGIACAAKLWARLRKATGDDSWLGPIRKALAFCMSMQVGLCRDSNLQGVIIEKILAPNGTDDSLIHIRDLGTIFFVQAACEALDGGVMEALDQ